MPPTMSSPKALQTHTHTQGRTAGSTQQVPFFTGGASTSAADNGGIATAVKSSADNGESPHTDTHADTPTEPSASVCDVTTRKRTRAMSTYIHTGHTRGPSKQGRAFTAKKPLKINKDDESTPVDEIFITARAEAGMAFDDYDTIIIYGGTDKFCRDPRMSRYIKVCLCV